MKFLQESNGPGRNLAREPQGAHASTQAVLMKISEVALRAGVLATTIRFYESVGVLPPAHRINGQRVYGPDSLDRLALIRFGLKTGFTLKEMKSLLSGFSSRATRRRAAQGKLKELRSQRDRIQLMERLLREIELCRCGTIRQVAERVADTELSDKLFSRVLKRVDGAARRDERFLKESRRRKNVANGSSPGPAGRSHDSAMGANSGERR
jgi:DNA-binding transcriptional MerR regulator